MKVCAARRQFEEATVHLVFQRASSAALAVENEDRRSRMKARARAIFCHSPPESSTAPSNSRPTLSPRPAAGGG